MSPVLPHLTLECLQKINKNSEEVMWPKVNQEYLHNEETIIIIKVKRNRSGLALARALGFVHSG